MTDKQEEVAEDRERERGGGGYGVRWRERDVLGRLCRRKCKRAKGGRAHDNDLFSPKDTSSAVTTAKVLLPQSPLT